MKCSKRSFAVVSVLFALHLSLSTGTLNARDAGIAASDHKGFVWIGGNNCPTSGLAGLKPVADDAYLKFTPDGKFMLQIGRSNQSKGDADTVNVHRAADAWVHAPTNELFVADGYGNHRVIVFDADTGAFKRLWGQLIRTGPTFARNLALSADAGQQFMYVGADKGITIVDRKTLDVVGTIQPSGILGPGHHIATDSKGNIYLAQTTAGMQKLVFKGMPPTQ